MKQRRISWKKSGLIVTGLLIMGVSMPALAQEDIAIKPDTSASALRRSITLRNLTLTPVQVDTIKKIRAEFFKRLDRLNAQHLQKKERDEKGTELQEWQLHEVRAVLTPDQHKQFDINADSLRTVNAAARSRTLKSVPIPVRRTEEKK